MQIHQFCKAFRSNRLLVSVGRMAKEVGINEKTLTSFENGQSTNMTHLHRYYSITPRELRSEFMDGLATCFEKDI